jgi:hypothetical protein
MSAITPKIFPPPGEMNATGDDVYTGVTQSRPMPPNPVPNLIPLTDMMPTVASPNNGANTGQGSGGGGNGGGGRRKDYDPFWGGGIGVKPHLTPGDGMDIAPPTPPLGGNTLASPLTRGKTLSNY